MGVGGRQCVDNNRNLYNFLKKSKNFTFAEIMGKIKIRARLLNLNVISSYRKKALCQFVDLKSKVF